MKFESIACNNCGAPLEVPGSVNFVTCNHCGSHLAVKRDEHVTYTEKLRQIDERTEKMQDELKSLRIDSELAKLDREWGLEKEGYMIQGKEGHKRIPTTTGSVIGGIVIVVFGVFWTVFAANITSGNSFGGIFDCFPLFGIVFIVFGIGMSIYAYTKAKDYLQAERKYRQRRSALMQKSREE